MTTITEILMFCLSEKASVFENSSNGSQTITGPRNIQDAISNQFCFIGSKFKTTVNEKVSNCKAGVLLIEKSCFEILNDDYSTSKTAFVVTENPKELMNRCIREFFISRDFISVVHPTATIHASVELPEHIYIGPNAVIEQGVSFGDYCTVESNAVIKEHTVIGNRVIIKSNSVIGGTGFGYVKDDLSGSYEVIPHFGKVIIEDDVHIGSCTCIDRGSLSDTIIKKGVKIDNLVHIAHNVQVGQNSMIIACSMIAGSVQIGDDSWVAPSVSIMNGVSVGEKAVLGLGSVVTKSVDSNQTVLGVPAIDIRSFKKLKNYQNEILQKD
ncbi:MAG: UDP-3-O-(3-hydroxymyristoyl)glucosamine N-acyltransferase [Balneola sp.]